jgi:D-sedoheptulose 7-phosphate isomerase
MADPTSEHEIALPPTRRFRPSGAHDELVRARTDEAMATIAPLGRPPLLDEIGRFADLVVAALSEGGKVVLFGNGGSAADATHLAAELVGRYMVERDPLPALSLTDNASSLSAIGNDYGYDDVFARQVRALGRPGDVAVGLSTSGRSENVVRGLRAAGRLGLRTVAMTGEAGGRLGAISDLCLRVPATSTARIQECHMVIGHTVCEIVERALARP